VAGLAEQGLSPVVIVLGRKLNRKQAKLAEIFRIELLGSRGVPIVNKEILGGIDAVNFHLEAPLTPNRRPRASENAPVPEVKRQRQNGSVLPTNHGKAWERVDLATLAASFVAGATLDELAAQCGRTRQGVLSQLQRLAHGNDALYGKLAELGMLKQQEAYRQLVG